MSSVNSGSEWGSGSGNMHNDFVVNVCILILVAAGGVMAREETKRHTSMDAPEADLTWGLRIHRALSCASSTVAQEPIRPFPPSTEGVLAASALACSPTSLSLKHHTLTYLRRNA